MTAYEDTKKELEDLLKRIHEERAVLVSEMAEYREKSLEQVKKAESEFEKKKNDAIERLKASKSESEKKIIELETILREQMRKEKAVALADVVEAKADLEKQKLKLKQRVQETEELRRGVLQMARERQIGFPWLAKAYDELFRLEATDVATYLETKDRPAQTAASVVREQSRLRRIAEQGKKEAQYIIEYYEHIAPFLLDLREEVDIPTEEDCKTMAEYSDEEKADAVVQFLSKEEFRKLSVTERNQLALDRFWKRPKSKWLIGRLYERYVGYLWEDQGYDVDYV